MTIASSEIVVRSRPARLSGAEVAPVTILNV
jgi:hypothetical protein